MEARSPDANIPVQLDLYCQRWSFRRARYRPAGEVFDPQRASVEPIDERQAKAFVVTHHYSGTYPAARFRAGIFVKEPFRRERLAGVGVFSVPMNQQVIPAYFPNLTSGEGVELGRFVLDDSLAANAESWAIARMNRLLRRELPGISGVVAYCDPIERRDIDGRLVKRGHVGTIYRATNASYRGRSSPTTLWLTPSGEGITDRLLSKIRLGEQGEGYAMARLREGGAPSRTLKENGARYVARLKEIGWLRAQRHPGNFVFTWRV
jgi:hypothetical protein